MEKSKRVTSTKVVCAKCGKDYYVGFVADGHRSYYCEECLKQMHLNRKKGEIKKVLNKKTNKESFEFVCDICENFRRASYLPKKENGKIWCKECENKHKLEERKKARKKIILVKSPKKETT